MKILKLEFMNINSIAGEWKIDFTDPSYTKNNLFVICGKTGSGKTTVLDVITLGLYGKTPRQKEYIAKTTNNIMTKDKGICYAKVTYNVGNVIYVSEWKQQRAYKKANQNLQSAHGTIYRLGEENNPIFNGDTTTHGELAKANAKIIQLDYDQFCRSIMLAQGEFSRFLECKESERAAILEKLNGTEKYRMVAQKVASIFSDANRNMIEAKAQLEACESNNLTEEQKKLYLKEIEEKQAAINEVDVKIKNATDIVNWYINIEEKIKINNDSKTNYENVKEAIAEFEPYSEKLKMAKKAKECKPFYEKLHTAQDDKENKSKELEKMNLSLTKAESEYQVLKNSLDKNKTEVANAENYISHNEDLWKRVRELDERLKAENSVAEEARERYESVKEEIVKCESSIKNNTDKLRNIESTLSELDSYIKDNNMDSGIAGILSGLGALINQYNKILNNKLEAGNELKTISDKIVVSDKLIHELKDKCDNLLLYLQTNQSDAQLPSVIASSKTVISVYSKNLEIVNKCIDKNNIYNNNIKSLEKKCQEYTDKKETIEKEIIQLFENDMMVVASIIQSRLKDGEACPVCGSKEHPACTGEVSFETDDKEYVSNIAAKIRKLNEDLASVKDALSEINREHSVLMSTIDNNTLEQKNAEKEIHNREEELNMLWQPWGLTANSENLNKNLALLTNKSLKFIEVTEQYSSAENEFKNAHNNQAVFKEKEIILNESILKYQTELDKCGGEITNLISGWIKISDLSSVYDYYNILLKRSEIFEEKMNSYNSLKQEQDKFVNTNKHLSDLLIDLNKRLTREKNNYDVNTEKLQNSNRERMELFGNKNVNDAESQAKNNLQQLKSELSKAEETSRAAENSLTEIKAKMARISQDICELDNRIIEAEKEFNHSLNENGLVDKNEYLVSILSPFVFTQLARKSDGLTATLAKAEQSLADSSEALKSVIMYHPDIDYNNQEEKSLRINEREELSTQRDNYLSRIAEIKSYLEKDNDNEALVAQKRKQFDEVNEVYQKWFTMHKWMGDANGNAFSTFVQGLTFKALLKIANDQLAIINKNYELVAEGDLSFKVFDSNFGDCRAISNLSGGEKFLVSLSLALAISEVASRNVKIDCLFMDEGFGTLSDEKLNAVMECLEAQKKQGKMLGIITHIPALIGEIGQKIQLEVDGLGHSSIKGPGVTLIKK